MQKMQPTPGPNRRLTHLLALFKPTPTPTRPRGTLQEQIRMPTKLSRDILFRRERFEIFNLRFANHIKHVCRPAFNQRHKTAMAERAVGSAEGEVVGEMGNGDGEVGGYTSFGRPDVAEVLAMFSAKGERGSQVVSKPVAQMTTSQV